MGLLVVVYQDYVLGNEFSMTEESLGERITFQTLKSGNSMGLH